MAFPRASYSWKNWAPWAVGTRAVSTFAVWMLLCALSPCVALAEEPPPAASDSETAPGQGEPPVTTADAAAGPRVGRHGVGFTAGLLSGLGFAYRRHFANDYGLQIGGVAWANRTESFFSLGVEAIRTISRSNKVSLYGVAAMSVFRNNGPEFDDSGCSFAPDAIRVPCGVERRKTTGSLNFGAGIGLEFTPGRHISVSFELPVSLMLDLEEQNRFKRNGIYPIPGASVIYFF